MRYLMYGFMSLMLIFNAASAKVEGANHRHQNRHHSKRSKAVTKEADYIIVGLGTAGSVAARYLSDPVNGKFKNSVLVLEAGQNRSNDPVVLAGPATIFGTIDDLAYSSKYSVTKLCPDSNPLVGFLASEQYSAGRMWFGSSAHNFMAATRGSSDRWDDLAQQVGDSQWSYNNLLPLMKFLETYHGPTTQPEQRGTSGPLQISKTLASFPFPQGFPSAVFSVTGAPNLPDYNVSQGNTAFSPDQVYSTPDLQTRSFGLDFLPRGILRADGKGKHGRQLKVVSGAFVSRVIFKGNKAIGVEYFFENEKKGHIAYAKKQVILCAGAPLSAAILQRSGIGPSEVLNDPKVNIPVFIDNPLVGQGLNEHYGVLFAMTQPTQLVNQLQNTANAYIDGRDFFAPAGQGDNIRRFQILFFPTLAVFPAVLLNTLGLNPSQPGIAGAVWNLRPKSRNGTAFIVDRSPFTFPDIRLNLYTDGGLDDPSSDLSASVAGYKIMQAIADTAGAELLYPPPSQFSSDEQLASQAGGDLNLSQLSVTNHYSSTCQMGTNMSNGVVSSHDLHVFGTKHLMVADGSIFPFPETGGGAWQSYIAGLKAAQILGFELPPQ
jgi:choline dehydrogenase